MKAMAMALAMATRKPGPLSMTSCRATGGREAPLQLPRHRPRQAFVELFFSRPGAERERKGAGGDGGGLRQRMRHESCGGPSGRTMPKRQRLGRHLQEPGEGFGLLKGRRAGRSTHLRILLVASPLFVVPSTLPAVFRGSRARLRFASRPSAINSASRGAIIHVVLSVPSAVVASTGLSVRLTRLLVPATRSSSGSLEHARPAC